MTEFSVIRCDNRACGKREEGKAHGGKGPNPRGWFTITQPFLTSKLAPSEHDFATWHVCSLECMAALVRQRFADARASREDTIASNLEFNEELRAVDEDEHPPSPAAR